MWLPTCAHLCAVIADFSNDIPGEKFHVDKTDCGVDPWFRPDVRWKCGRAKTGRLLSFKPRLLPGEFALLSRRWQGRLLQKGTELLRGRQGLLRRRSHESRGRAESAGCDKDLLLCCKDDGESRCPSRRLLQGQARVLRRKISLLFGQPKTRLLSGGSEVLCRKQGLLHGPEMTP